MDGAPLAGFTCECRRRNQGGHCSLARQYVHCVDQVRRLGTDWGIFHLGRGDPLRGRRWKSGTAVGRRPTLPAGGNRGAPVRLRQGALHLQLHRVDRAVQRRRPLRAVRGVSQMARNPGRPPERAPGKQVVVGSSCHSAGRNRGRESVVSDGHPGVEQNPRQAAVEQVHPRRQGTGASRDLARRLRRAAGVGLRTVRGWDDAADPQRHLRRHRYGHDRPTARGSRDRACRSRPRACCSAKRPAQTPSLGSRERSPAHLASSGSST